MKHVFMAEQMPGVSWRGVKHAVFSGVINHASLSRSLMDERQENTTYQSGSVKGLAKDCFSVLGPLSPESYKCYSLKRHSRKLDKKQAS